MFGETDIARGGVCKSLRGVVYRELRGVAQGITAVWRRRHSAFASLLLLVTASTAQALTLPEAMALSVGETDARIEALERALLTADERTAAFLQALSEDAVKTAAGKVFTVQGDRAIDPVTGAPAVLPEGAEDVVVNNRLRGEIDTALAGLRLFSKIETQRRDAIRLLQGQSDERRLPLIERALATETVPALKEQLLLVRATILLNSADKAKRMEAARQLAGSANPGRPVVGKPKRWL